MKIRTELNRFEPKVLEYERYPIIPGKVLLYGSSFFTNWGYDRAAAQLCDLGSGVVNHGIGGATGDELLYYYGRLVYPYKPCALILRGGANDLFRGYTPEEAADLSIRVCEWARTDFPGLRVIVLPIFDFPSAPARDAYTLFPAYNALMREYVDETPGAFTLDIGEYLHDTPPYSNAFDHFRDVFGPDGLHLTDAGYNAFAPWFSKRVNGLLQA
ncbi:MAG: GDSL-type esterase/lipase family protein [Clostridiaceae bacterium]|nr:GDSL-type esterase/lipase family protein [Clostridiaceae bacterium]